MGDRPREPGDRCALAGQPFDCGPADADGTPVTMAVLPASRPVR